MCCTHPQQKSKDPLWPQSFGSDWEPTNWKRAAEWTMNFDGFLPPLERLAESMEKGVEVDIKSVDRMAEVGIFLPYRG
jgi:hypothetical protein